MSLRKVFEGQATDTGYILFALALTVFLSFLTPGVQSAETQTVSEHAPPPPWARTVYESNCAVCHGTNGDGNGPAAYMFRMRPRDFRSGIFKFRSTPSGSLPTDKDLLRSVTQGLRWTGMLGRPDLSESDRKAVIQYIKTFSSRFATEKPLLSVVVSPPPKKTTEITVQGNNMYRDAGCASCHGDKGSGDGPSSQGLKDDWGWPTQASDLTWRPLKRGSSLQDLFLTIATGMSGTPMPSYSESLSGDQIWSLVFYLETLVPPERRLYPQQFLGEERQGWMALHMGGMMGPGMMNPGMMRPSR